VLLLHLSGAFTPNELRELSEQWEGLKDMDRLDILALECATDNAYKVRRKGEEWWCCSFWCW